MNLLTVIHPELILIVTACALFIVGVFNRTQARRASAIVAIAALALVFALQVRQLMSADQGGQVLVDSYNAFRVFHFANYIKALSAGIGILFVLLSWPTDADAQGNSSVNFGTEAAEYFGLLLLSISGIFIVAGANDLVLLFLGVELASIPTYIMVSISRPLPAAQEAGVKYFFLGAMSAAIMLFGFSYLYGTTGVTNMSELMDRFNMSLDWTGNDTKLVVLTPWQILAVIMLIAGFAFKMAAVPLHFYAGDVYQGAATPVTALLSFVPKTAGLVALLKILFVIGGGVWAIPPVIGKLIMIMAILTMTVGNLLGLLQHNVKRMLAYSSVAHSGYLLVGVATLLATRDAGIQTRAMHGVLFYIAAYGIMNAAAFGVLMMLPAKPPPAWDRRGRFTAGGSAETLDDIAGAGIRHVGLGLAMAIACFSLIGLPLTVGFFGKLYLIRPALDAKLYWLVVITMINAAISAAYYLRIVGTMFLRPETSASAFDSGESEAASIPHSVPVATAIILSCAATVLLGTVFPTTNILDQVARTGSTIDYAPNDPARDTQPAPGQVQRTDAPINATASRP
ncbi:MAG: NADH-quinone oxidoreductase subunit N [Anaerolineae bacterium]|nr:NADH-quinone oxidoreductase subunit N [Phycisphaerae bacterium]